MKILINTEPIAVKEMFFPCLNTYINMVDDVFKDFLSDYDWCVLVSERTKYQAQEKQYDLKNSICIEDYEYYQAFNNEYMTDAQIREIFYFGVNDAEVLHNLDVLYKNKLKDWYPDIIISFEFHNKIFDYIYPNALQFVYSQGIFRREFVPNTVLFDPIGAHCNSFLNTYKKEINSLYISESQNLEVEKLKKELTKIIRENSPVKSLLNKYKKKFDYLLLLPCQFSGHWAFDTESQFKTQWDMVAYVLRKIPSNIGVIVTEHPHNRFLQNAVYDPGGFISWLRAKYPNFIYIKELEKYAGSSLLIMSEIDGVINTSSSVGQLALLFDKKIISLGRTSNDSYKDVQGVENILNVLSSPSKDKNSLIFWLLTRYNFYNFQYNNKQWLNNFFKESLLKYKKGGIDFSFYSENISISDLSGHILSYIKSAFDNYNIINSTEKTVVEYKQNKVSLLQKIFSVKNENNHKILRIIGLKIKFKKRN